MNEDRLKYWNDNCLPAELAKLSPRLRKDIMEISTKVNMYIPKVESTYIWGDVGCGKTVKAVFMYLSELRNNFVDRKYSKGMFVIIPELLLNIRSSFSTHDTSEIEMIDRYSSIDLLVMDDLGMEKITEWSLQCMFLIINRRYENMKKTIFTSNLNLEQLANKLGEDRISTRIQQMCKIVKMPNINHRERV